MKAIVLLQSLFIYIMFAQSYLQSTKIILEAYRGEEPFSSFLKKYFSAQKKYGPRDRKQIAHLCYCFFRLGKWEAATIEERIKVALFLCSYETNSLAQQLLPEWIEEVDKNINEKFDFLRSKIAFDWQSVFPWTDQLSGEIDHKEFTASFFVQPKLFLRIRPGKKDIVTEKLQKAGLSFLLEGEGNVALANATKIDDILETDREVVIQDLSSQKTLNALFGFVDKRKQFSAWDCCAASGGKSLLLADHFTQVDLSVSDVRESILFNLRKRFERAGLKKYKWFVQDVSAAHFTPLQNHDVVICDAPCSGSGTWSRTPEQLYFFETKKIDHYSNLQKKIALNASKAVKQDGFFVYITCSVSTKENQEVVVYIQENTQLKLQTMQYIKGYNIQADTLFTALFKL